MCHGSEPPRMTPDARPARRQDPRQPEGAVLPLDGPPSRHAADGRPGSLTPAAHLHMSAGPRSRDVTTSPEGGVPPVSPVTHGAVRVPLPPLPLTPPGPAAPTCASRTLQQHLNTSPATTDKTGSAMNSARPWLWRSPEDVKDLPGPVTSREAAQSISDTPPGAAATPAPSQAMGATAPRRNPQPSGPLKPLRLHLVLVVLLLTFSMAEGECQHFVCPSLWCR